MVFKKLFAILELRLQMEIHGRCRNLRKVLLPSPGSFRKKR